jgi:hypothetical protein
MRRESLNVIGTHRSSCVASLKRVVVEHEAMAIRTRRCEKKIISTTKACEDGRSEGILTAGLKERFIVSPLVSPLNGTNDLIDVSALAPYICIEQDIMIK